MVRRSPACQKRRKKIISGYFPKTAELVILINEDGERFLRSCFEPRGSAETPGWRPTGYDSIKPAMSEGLAEAH